KGMSAANVAASSARVSAVIAFAVAITAGISAAEAFSATKRCTAAIAVTGMRAVSVTASVIAAVTPAPSTVVPAPAAITPAIPRADADEETVIEPVRAVVPIRCACVWSVVVVAVWAVRRIPIGHIYRWRFIGRSGIGRDAHANTERNLCVRLGRGHQHDA